MLKKNGMRELEYVFFSPHKTYLKQIIQTTAVLKYGDHVS